MAFTSKIPLIKVPKPWKAVPLPVLYEKPQTLDKFDINHEWVRARIEYFARDTTDQIMERFVDMQISPHRSDAAFERRKDLYTGDLERSIHWTIVNNAGGDMALVEFYYLFYGRFLELSASGWLSAGKNPKYPPISPGMVPQMEDRRGVQVGNRPWKAKPFITSEIRRQAGKLLRRLAKNYAYTGGMKIFSTFAEDPYAIGKYDFNIAQTSEAFWDFVNKNMGRFV